MKNWSDEQLGRLLSEAMAAHESDIDPERARPLTTPTGPVRRHWPAMIAAAAVVALVCLASVYAADRHADRTASSQTPRAPKSDHTQRTTAENYGLALAASKRAIALVVVPPGSTRLGGKPAGWPPGGMSEGPSDARLTRTAWWSIPMSQADVASFLTSHSPEGMRHPAQEPEQGVVHSGGPHGVMWTDYGDAVPTDEAAYSTPRLLIQFKQIGDRTVLRADSEVAARYAVPARAHITNEVNAVTIHLSGLEHRGGPHTKGDPGSVMVRLALPKDAEKIARLVRGFNNLHPSLTTGSGCAGGPRQDSPIPKDTVTFHTATSGTRKTTHTLVASLLPTSCLAQVQVIVDGKPLATTLDPTTWDQLVSRSADLIWSGLLSRGRVRRPSRCLGAGASCFVVVRVGERVVGDARSD